MSARGNFIPDFQRDFVRTRKQVEELLNSVVNRYFIGTLLLLESPTSNLRFAPWFILGVEADPKSHASISYVLDGQQRLTSLFYAFLEPAVPLQDEALPTRFFLNLNGCQDVVGVQKIEDLLRKLHPKEERRLLAKLREVLMQSTGIDIERYPSMTTFRSADTLTVYLNTNGNTLEPGKRDELNRLLQSILDYEVAVVTLPHDTPDDEIVSTFEEMARNGVRSCDPTPSRPSFPPARPLRIEYSVQAMGSGMRIDYFNAHSARTFPHRPR